MTLFLYVATALLVGIACEQWRIRWRVLAAMAGVATGILLNTWPHLYWNEGRVLERLLEGVYWYTLASIVVFVGPLMVGLYGRRLIRVIVRWRTRAQ